MRPYGHYFRIARLIETSGPGDLPDSSPHKKHHANKARGEFSPGGVLKLRHARTGPLELPTQHSRHRKAALLDNIPEVVQAQARDKCYERFGGDEFTVLLQDIKHPLKPGWQGT